MTYALLAFGGGRRVERFGDVVLDRPCAVDASRTAQHAVRCDTDAAFELVSDTENRNESRGVWHPLTPRGELALREPWTISLPLTLELRTTPFGHIGLFPEQIANWTWLTDTASTMRQRLGAAPRFLNLFGYTGGSTLAAALGGGDVTHVDAAKGVVTWGRHNSTLNEHAFPVGAATRWVVDDARKFVQRERRRGNRYHGVILDPPSFGHGTRGERWQILRDLPPLLADVAAILEPPPLPRCVLLTCHTTGIDANTLAAWWKTAAAPVSDPVHCAPMTLTTSAGCVLRCGWSVRVG